MLEEIAEPLVDWTKLQRSELGRIRTPILVLFEFEFSTVLVRFTIHPSIENLNSFPFCNISFFDTQKVNRINGFQFRIY